MNSRPLYFDYSATTPVDPRVAEKMCAYLTMEGQFGNPASRSHAYGWEAEAAVEQARKDVADLLNCDAKEIIWTSGATESDNLAIKGAAHFHAKRGKHIVTSKTEHKAVLDSCRQLEREGYEVTYLDPEPNGLIDINKLEAALRADTTLVSIMHVNNEIGVIQDIAAIGDLCRSKKILFLGYGKEIDDFDHFGIGLAAGQSSESSKWQGVMELYYQWQITKELLVTPDFQLVTGLDDGDDLGFVLGVRAGIVF